MEAVNKNLDNYCPALTSRIIEIDESDLPKKIKTDYRTRNIEKAIKFGANFLDSCPRKSDCTTLGLEQDNPQFYDELCNTPTYLNCPAYKMREKIIK